LVINATPLALYPQEKNPIPIVQEPGWVKWSVFMGAEKLAAFGFQIPDRNETLE
jgi:hypothetical protein